MDGIDPWLRRIWSIVIILALTAGGALAKEPPTYLRDVRPILELHCTGCHSGKNAPDLSLSGGLALDGLESIVKSGAVVPGEPAKSEVLARLRETDPDLRMPRDAPALPADAIALIELWIESGAPRGEAAGSSATVPRAVRLRPRRPLDLRIPVGLSLPKEQARVPAELPRKGLELRLRVAPLPPAVAVAFGPPRAGGGPDLLVCGGHGNAVVWDLSRASPARVLTPGEGPVHAVRFARDGKKLALAGGRPGQAGVIIVFDTESWTVTHELRGHAESIHDLAFSPDGRFLASASQDRTARVWDLESGKEAKRIEEHSDAVHGAAFLDGGKSLATCGADRAVKITDLSGEKPARTFSGHEQPVLALAADPEGKSLVSAGLEPGLRFWNLADGKTLRNAGGHSGRVEEIAFSRDGKTLASAGSDRTVRIWNAEKGSEMKRLEAAEWLHSVDLDSAGRRAAAGSWDGTVRIWDVSTGKLLGTLVALAASRDEDLEWAAASAGGCFVGSDGIWRDARVGSTKGEGPEAPLVVLRPFLDDAEKLSSALGGGEPAPPSVPQEWEY